MQPSGNNLKNVTVQLDGTLVAVDDFEKWPVNAHADDDEYSNFFQLNECENVVFTGGNDGKGCIEGQGIGWWDRAILPQLFGKLKGKRPKLLCFSRGQHLTIENIHLHNSPSFHLILKDVKDVEVRSCSWAPTDGAVLSHEYCSR